MAEHGGYRKPENPAPVSGPGKFARRTDTGPAQSISAAPDQSYGEAGQQAADQRTAPMQAANPLPNPPSPADMATGSPQDAGQTLPRITQSDFGRPTEYPGEPVTTGVPIGPGAGPEALNLPSPEPAPATGAMTKLLASLSASDTTGVLAQLYETARTQGV